MIRRREVRCDKEIKETDSLQEEDGAQTKIKSPGISSEVTNKRIMKLFISHKEQLLQQQRDSQRNLRAEASYLWHLSPPRS